MLGLDFFTDGLLLTTACALTGDSKVLGGEVFIADLDRDARVSLAGEIDFLAGEALRTVEDFLMATLVGEGLFIGTSTRPLAGDLDGDLAFETFLDFLVGSGSEITEGIPNPSPYCKSESV